MKGIVFTELLEMVESKYGLETVDHIITVSNLDSKGAYTSVGTYDFVEMQNLLFSLSNRVNLPINDLIYTYGLFFFKVLLESHPKIFEYYKDPITFLSSIENHIHVQVLKLYPGAELPTFNIISKDSTSLEVIYSSERCMYMFAKALMEKTFEYFDENAIINYVKLKEDGSQVKFVINTCN